MRPARFLEVRRPHWDRLQALIDRCGRRGTGALSETELHELARLYPAVAVDVARARMYQLDRPTQQRINHLAIAAHGLLYRRPHRRPLAAVARFLVQDYPRLCRRQWACLTLSVALFLASSVGTYLTVLARPATAYIFVPGNLDVHDGGQSVSAQDISERFRKMPQPPMAAGIMTNNITVAFLAFALGITAGLGTCYVLLVNAMMLGGFVAHFFNHHLGYELCSFIMPHGLLEITAILIAAGAGLRLGLSLAIPGRQTRGAALRHGARDAVLLMLGTVPMFIVAGLIEGFVTPSYLPGGVKIALGVSVWAVTLAYLALGGRGRAAEPAETIS